MQWLTLHVVSANIKRCKKSTRILSAIFLAQVTNKLFSFGEPDNSIPGIPGILNIFPKQV